ncbi:MAG TPA: hypothetical protein VF759_08270 [Allosphingosinicella sp.]|jgi:hypothetical protein
MRYRIAVLIFSLAASGAPCAARSDPPADELIREVWVSRNPNLDDISHPETALAGDGRPPWIWLLGSKDIPPDLRDRPFRTHNIIAVEVDATGRPQGCSILRRSFDPRLDSIACDRALSVRYSVRYAAPRKPVARTHVMGIRWRVLTRAEDEARRELWAAMPPSPTPPRYVGGDELGWPRLAWRQGTELAEIPQLQRFYPAEALGREGTVSLELGIWPEDGRTECEIGASSGSLVLDRAACRVARKLDLRFNDACEGCLIQSIPLQFVWRRQGSHIRTPIRETWPPTRVPDSAGRVFVGWRAVKPDARPITRADFEPLRGARVTNSSFGARLVVDQRGRPQACDVSQSSGNRSVDERACALLVKRMRYTRRTDVFGDLTADYMDVRLDLDPLL